MCFKLNRSKLKRHSKNEMKNAPKKYSGHILEPTIPFLIIQSNFGEELQVEAGLPSFRVSLKRKATYALSYPRTFTEQEFIDWNLSKH